MEGGSIPPNMKEYEMVDQTESCVSASPSCVAISNENGGLSTSSEGGTSCHSSVSSSGTTPNGGVVVRPRKSREELDAANLHLESLWNIDDSWILVFDDLITSHEKRCRRTSESSKDGLSPWRRQSPLRSSLSSRFTCSAGSSPVHQSE